jgi:hypothetical protein
VPCTVMQWTFPIPPRFRTVVPQAPTEVPAEVAVVVPTATPETAVLGGQTPDQTVQMRVYFDGANSIDPIVEHIEECFSRYRLDLDAPEFGANPDLTKRYKITITVQEVTA